MIVRPRPGLLGLIFSLHGSVIPLIAGRVILVAAISAVVTVLYHLRPGVIPVLPGTPFGLLGLALSIFLGFRNSACYDRWWEARKQWGQLLATARNLSRRIGALSPQLFPDPSGFDPVARDRAITCILAFAHALRARLRGQDVLAAIGPWLPAETIRGLETSPNLPDTILRHLADGFAEHLRAGRIGEVGFHDMESHLETLCAVQAACDRIRSTPTPFAYSLLLHRTAWLFCLLAPFTMGAVVPGPSAPGVSGFGAVAWFAAPLASAVLAYAFFGLDALGDTLENPFVLGPNTLPLDAMVRTLEIELLHGIGCETTLPPLQPVDHVLT